MPDTSKRPAAGDKASAPSPRLLVVEDHATNRELAAAMLGRLGYQVDVVASGAEAIDALSEVPYDAVLMDCYMPEMDGYEATAEIRRTEPSTRHTPIIAMTGAAMPEDREKCVAAGMDDFIAKPVQMDELERVIDRWTRLPGHRG